MFAAACFFFPFRNTLVFGQANVTILFVWTLGVYLFKRQRPMASALCFALGTVLKISPVVRRAAPRPAPAVAVAGCLRGGSCRFHRGFHLAIRLADQPDLADGISTRAFLPVWEIISTAHLQASSMRCAVRGISPPLPLPPNGPFLPD